MLDVKDTGDSKLNIISMYSSEEIETKEEREFLYDQLKIQLTQY